MSFAFNIVCAVQFTGERDDINVKSVFYFQFDIIFGFQTEYRHQAKRSAKIETTANKVTSNKREIATDWEYNERTLC